jgi:hypothetical protein
MTHKAIWECETSKDHFAPAGTIVLYPNVWAFTPDGEVTPSMDITVELDNAATYGDCLLMAESAALDYVKRFGATDIRQYFVEDIMLEDGVLRFVLGT